MIEAAHEIHNRRRTILALDRAAVRAAKRHADLERHRRIFPPLSWPQRLMGGACMLGIFAFLTGSVWWGLGIAIGLMLPEVLSDRYIAAYRKENFDG